MSTVSFAESKIEEVTLSWFEGLGYEILHGPDIDPEKPNAERTNFDQVILVDRLRTALLRINSNVPKHVLDEAIRKILLTESPSLIENNRRFHRYLVDGVPVEYQSGDRTVYDQVWLLDFGNPELSDWLAVNQFTVIENHHTRRPDVVVFVNGLPLAVLELKNPADETATVKGAFNQFQTYMADIPSLFTYNQVLGVSDGVEARCGTISSGWSRFMPWRTIDGQELASETIPQLEVLLKGIFEKQRFLDMVRHFIVFDETRQGVVKKMAAYHQFHAVQKAVDCTVRAVEEDRRIGVVWHTQGSGKSLTMTFYAGKVIQHSSMDNPTLVVLTDRNDLDDQLFGTFASCHEILRQEPVQAESRAKLRELLKVASGGVFFTTIQKFLPEQKGDQFPMLSDRRNIVVIADEAHRSQYDFIDGFARHMRDALPNASFIGFTATPIESSDRSTPAVFGEYIDVYDIYQSIDDGATVPIYYEARLAKLELDEEERPHIDPDFEEVTEGEEETVRQKLKTKWARLEALVGAEKRIRLLAEDLVDHFEKRLEVMDGKGMIVCMSRRICVDLCNEIVKLRPKWHNKDDEKGLIKVVMTGSATDPLEWQQHIRDKSRRQRLADRFKDPKEPFKLAIVRDMWLTGFDVPCLHTMYLDKPMRGHGLMQAIARVNRVFKDKPGGLVVDYLGIAHELRKALSNYSERDRGQAGVPQDVVIAVLKEKYEIVRDMYHGFDYSQYLEGSPEEQLKVIPKAMNHILSLEDGRNRYLIAVAALSKAFALAVPHEEALAIRDEVGFFQTVRASIIKHTVEDRKSPEELDTAVQQILSRAVASDQVVDIFKSAGLKKPDISVLSDEFLEEIRDLPHKNLAMELLRKLLNDEIKVRARRNLVQSRAFSEMLEETIRKYHNRTIEAAQVIEELIRLAKEMREAHKRGEKLGLHEDELAFYDALETNDSAVAILGDEILKNIALELVDTVRRNVTIDWTVRETVRAKLRVAVKRVLRKYGYPPDKQEKATRTVLEQAELMGAEVAA